jgi:hypothetical protein
MQTPVLRAKRRRHFEIEELIQMIRKLALAVMFVALGTMSALAADISGKWTADIAGRQGTPTTTTFTFAVSGATVTGKVTTPRGDTDISDGKIAGDTLTFSTSMSMNGNTMTQTYTGKIDGDTIKFSRAMGDRPATEFTATKVK